MNKFKAIEYLDEIKNLLPIRYRVQYKLVDNSRKLYAQFAKQFNSSIKETQKYYLGVLGSKDYQKLMPYRRSSKLIPFVRNRQESIFGLSTNPILINYQVFKTKLQIQFCYLHEVGHILGLKISKGKNYGSEKMADRFAVRVLNKIGYKLDLI